MLAILNNRGMGGPSLLPAAFKRISDFDLIHVYLAPREEDGAHIPLRERMRRAAGWVGVEEDELAEMPADPIAALNLPREALLMGVPMDYVSMFFGVWRMRGADDATIMSKFREKLQEVPPWGGMAVG